MSEPDCHTAYRNSDFDAALYSRQQEFNTSIVFQAYAARSYDQRTTHTDGTIDPLDV
jgi:hypothetical protein